MAKIETLPYEDGMNTLPANPFKLLDFQYLRLREGVKYQGVSASCEILAVIMGGKGTFVIDGKLFPSVGGRPNVFAGKPHSVYIPCGVDYTIIGEGILEVALVSAPSEQKSDPYLIGPERVASGVWGAANFNRTFHQILTQTSQPDLPAQRLIVGETYTPSGNWSTYPPHKHEKDDLPGEAWHEELYYFKINPADGFGLTRCYSSTEDTAFVVRNHTILLASNGYHTVVSAPGYTTYYLWALAGNQRVQAVIEDPALSWVSRTVPMLKALGH